MVKKKSTEVRAKAAVGRERRLALALRALLDSLDGQDSEIAVDGAGRENVIEAEKSAEEILSQLGYSDLESIPRRVTRLNESLKQAVEKGDGKLIAQLGLELDRAKLGLPPAKAKVGGKAKRATSTPTATPAGNGSSSES